MCKNLWQIFQNNAKVKENYNAGLFDLPIGHVYTTFYVDWSSY